MASLKQEVRSNDGSAASTAKIDMKFELVVIPVSDPDRAKEFYGRLGWRLDGDFADGADWRGILFAVRSAIKSCCPRTRKKRGRRPYAGQGSRLDS